MDVLQSLLPIVLALAAGFAAGRFLPGKIGSMLVRCILPLVWLLLFLIGAEFGEVILSARSVGQVIRSAAVFAVLTTLLPCALIFATRVRGAGAGEAGEGRSGGKHLQAIWPPLKECCLALSMVVLGSLFFLGNATFLEGAFPLPSSSAILMALIALVGIDLARVKLSARWFSWRVLMVPGLVVAGSFAGAAAASLLTGETMRTSMALSSGFGWFTLSGVMVGSHLGQTYGTMALMIDLFRELLAIIALYMLGRYHPAVGIGSAGATALDSTLPIVKQACHPDAVPMALVSGFVLTILAPVFIAFFLS
ncbi:lysine exporter LysO family protein [Paracidovorax cattleyae]|uniref:Uncharacterized membrane protein YbjE, DUF340 family n=1 Tax=Paracidovorax cattleyae TaxID=80868 RepID=A0A1H0SHD0_9BURK|nr:lysine exporter LysO family protein [Paracidovorax cattleyae]AVS73214.1 lysine exporter LysO family protein [Paracidovorax cattleyae]MBF9263317.1 lysine exporter LysO family protein [Paracidovorax cattleyae]SDP40929.1 Uncharacterized membrane protein YbjE, DUF340 family [Paracidovorax cattleyae]